MDLSPTACRVLGSLAEKRLTTPDQYPLTVNALQSACNQKSARDPVMHLSESDVQQALRELRDEGLARTSPVRGRVPRHEHTLDVQLDLDDGAQAVIGVLLLRGPQTVGEIRTRTDRWHGFGDLDEVQAVLDHLAAHPFLPLAEELPREPGRRETRWAQLLGDPSAAAAPIVAPAEGSGRHPQPESSASTDGASLSDRVQRLEGEVATLRAEVEQLRSSVAPIVEELG